MFKKVCMILLPALLMSLMLSLVLGCAPTPAPPGEEEAAVVKAAPKVTTNPAVAKIDKKLKMVIIGSGFEPGQEFRLLVTGPDQPPSDIRGMCTPEVEEDAGEWTTERALKADETGAWITVWTLKRYIKALGKVDPENKGEGCYTIQVTDADFNLLASAPFALADTTKPEEEWPGWAQVLLK